MKKVLLLILILTAFSSCSGQTEAEREETEAQTQTRPINISAGVTSETETPEPAGPEQLDFDAQYIRAFGAYEENAEYPAATVISSRDELDGYYEKKLNGPIDSDEVSSNRYGFLKRAVDKYSDDYFVENSLIIISLFESSGSTRHSVESVSDNGDIVIRRFIGMTDDIGVWDILIGLKGIKSVPTKWNVSYIDEKFLNMMRSSYWGVSYEWDLSELMFVQEYINAAGDFAHEATVVSLDGTVKKIDFASMPELSVKLENGFYEYGDYLEKCNEVTLNCMDNADIPVDDKIGPVPADIIDLINETGDITLIGNYSGVSETGQTCTYLAVGLDAEKRLVKIGEWGDVSYFAADVKVTGLYERICEYAGFKSR